MTIHLAPPGHPDVVDVVRRSWGEPVMAVHGRLVDLPSLPAVIARDDGTVGVLTYERAEAGIEILSCDAEPPGRGTGHELAEHLVDLARRGGCTGSPARRRTTTSLPSGSGRHSASASTASGRTPSRRPDT